MTRFPRALACLMTLLLLCMSISAMAAKAKPKPKPKAKPKASATNHATLGTTQLKGEYADIGSTYTLGKDDPRNMTLKSAEYSVEQLVIGDYIYYPRANEKLLVLRFNVHNPRQQEAFTRYDTWSITAVDAKGENHEHIQDAGVVTATETGHISKTGFSMQMKPAQKVDVITAIVVPAAGEVGKVIFKSQDNLVLRYLLSGKVKPLAAPFADPADPTGTTALPKVTGKVGEYCPINEFSFKFEGASFSDKPYKGQELGEGNRNLFIAATIKNAAPTKQFFRYDSLQSALKDADGADLEWRQEMLLASRDASVELTFEPGQELRVRIPFEVPKDVSLTKYTITKEDSRVYEFDVSGAK